MKKLFVLLIILFLSVSAFAKTYNARVFNSEPNSEKKENLAEVETADGINLQLENGDILVEDNDLLKARGKAYIIVYIDKNRQIMIRKDTKRLKDILK